MPRTWPSGCHERTKIFNPPSPSSRSSSVRRPLVIACLPSQNAKRAPSTATCQVTFVVRASVRLQRPRAGVREVGEDPVHADVAELSKLNRGIAVVRPREKDRFAAQRPHVDEESQRVGARNEIVWRQYRAVDRGGNHQPRVRADSVRVRLDHSQLFVRWDLAFDELNQLDLRLGAYLAEVRFERLNEHGRRRGVPPVMVEHREHSILEWQPDAAEVCRMLRLGIDTDWPAKILPELLRKLDHLVKRGDLELPVPGMRPELEPLARTQRLDLG